MVSRSDGPETRMAAPGQPDARALGHLVEALANDGTLAAWIEDDPAVYAMALELLRAVQQREDPDVDPKVS